MGPRHIITSAPAALAASQAEVDAGTEAAKYVSPLTLKNFKGIQGFFLDASGALGTGVGWADAGLIDDIPVTLYNNIVTERTIYMFYAVSSLVLTDVDPEFAFTTYTTGLPVVTTEDTIRWRLEARYYAIGESTAKAADETLFATQTFSTIAGNTVQDLVSFTLDRTLIASGDIIKFTLSRLGGDVIDTYGFDLGVGQAGLVGEMLIVNP